MYSDLIGKTIEVYVDNMQMKSLKATNYTKHLKVAFEILRKYLMKLNPLKCAFGLASRNFLGYMVN